MGGKASKSARGTGQSVVAPVGSALWEARIPRQPGEPPRILFLGPEGAGKTALLEMLLAHTEARKLRTPPPSLQPRAFDLRAEGQPFTAVDQPGADHLRAWWAAALREADGVVFAVDSSDVLQLKLLRVTLHGLVPLLNATGAPVLLLATKQDVQGSLSPGRLAAQLALVDPARAGPALRVPFATRGVSLLAPPEAAEAALAWVVERAKPGPQARPKPQPRERKPKEKRERRPAQPPAEPRRHRAALHDNGYGYSVSSDF